MLYPLPSFVRNFNWGLQDSCSLFRICRKSLVHPRPIQAAVEKPKFGVIHCRIFLVGVGVFRIPAKVRKFFRH